MQAKWRQLEQLILLQACPWRHQHACGHPKRHIHNPFIIPSCYLRAWAYWDTQRQTLGVLSRSRTWSCSISAQSWWQTSQPLPWHPMGKQSAAATLCTVLVTS